jgi:hypothetical protein
MTMRKTAAISATLRLAGAGCDRPEPPVLAAAGSGSAAACHLLDPIRSLENA